MKDKKVLLVRGGDDPASTYAFSWAGYIKECLIKKGYSLIECVFDPDPKTCVENSLKHNDIRAVVFYGHGNTDGFKARRRASDVVIHIDNADILKGKIIYAVTCYTAQNLGQTALKKGATAYFGYKDKFYFLIDESEVAFKICSEIGMKELIDNKDCSSAQNMILKAYDDCINFYLTGGGKSHVNAWQTAICLSLDKDNFVFIGDPKATL